jgi:hypothetical protein
MILSSGLQQEQTKTTAEIDRASGLLQSSRIANTTDERPTEEEIARQYHIEKGRHEKRLLGSCIQIDFG